MPNEVFPGGLIVLNDAEMSHKMSTENWSLDVARWMSFAILRTVALVQANKDIYTYVCIYIYGKVLRQTKTFIDHHFMKLYSN